MESNFPAQSTNACAVAICQGNQKIAEALLRDDVKFIADNCAEIKREYNQLKADGSIALMDTALRRRFDFVEIMPRLEILSDNVDGVNLQDVLEKLNQRIELLRDREHTIGHAYFCKCRTIDDVVKVFLNKIIPLLQEYFFDDCEQIRAVLGDKFVKLKPYRIDAAAFKVRENYAL